MRAVEQEHGGAGRLVLALVYLEVGILNVQRQFRALALNGTGERGGDVEIKRIAKFIEPRGAAGFDASGKITRVVASEALFPQSSHQIAQGLVTEKVQTLVRDFEFGLLLGFAHLPADA